MRTARSSIAQFAAMPASEKAKIGLNGLMLFIVGFSLVGSGFSMLRLSVLGLRVHTYLMVVGAFFPLLAVTRLHLIPSKILFELMAFASLYFATTIPGGVDYGEGIKMFAAVVTIITMAMLVRNWNDFVAGVLGMSLAVAVLAVKGLEAETAGGAGIKAIQEANRNTYSLYALPPILLGCYILVRGRPDPIIRKVLLAVSILVSSLCICLNLNRSGWLGLGVIALLIIREKSFKAAIIFALLGVGVFFLIATMFSSSTGALQTRVYGTQSSRESDHMRWLLIKKSAQVALENPLLGISPQELPFVLGDYVGFSSGAIVAHNVFAQIAAGSGLIALFLLFHIGYMFWTWIPAAPFSRQGRVLFKESQKIMRLLLILWAIRGCFTHEIIYSPAFCMAIGLVLGLELSNSPKLSPTMNTLSGQTY